MPKPHRSMTRQAVNRMQCQFPDILEDYQARISGLSIRDSTSSAEQLIEQAWTECRLQRQPRPTCKEAAKLKSTGNVVDLIHPTVTTLWQLRAHILKMQKRGGLRCYIRLWRAYARLQKIQMQLRRKCRDAKKVKIQHLLQDAASQPQGLPSVFHLLRWIASSVPKRKLQLRTDKGLPCSTQEALQEIRTYFDTLYHTPVRIPAWRKCSLLNSLFAFQWPNSRRHLRNCLPTKRFLPRFHQPCCGKPRLLVWREDLLLSSTSGLQI